ncbi:hypothetical protein NHX12_002439, partial [Muraenolepis orangiensis]
LVEKIGGEDPFPSFLLPGKELLAAAEAQQGPSALLPPRKSFCSPAREEVDVLLSIRRGVMLSKVATDDRSAPRVLG